MKQTHFKVDPAHWYTFSTIEQMANIGDEVGRYYKWKAKGKDEIAKGCLYRAIELIDLTKSDPKNKNRLSELTRLKEFWLDSIMGNNSYQQTEEQWTNYFDAFGIYASKLRREIQ